MKIGCVILSNYKIIYEQKRSLPSYMEITNSLDNEKSESQHSSQPLDQVNYGTQPDEMV